MWINTAPSPEKVVEAVAKVLETRYDRKEMKRYAFEKFGVGNVEKFLPLAVFSEVAF